MPFNAPTSGANGSDKAASSAVGSNAAGDSSASPGNPGPANRGATATGSPASSNGNSPGSLPASVPGSPIFTSSTPSFVGTGHPADPAPAGATGAFFDGNHDGIPDAGQPDVADVKAATTGQMVVIDGGGHALTNVQAIAAPVGNTSLPLGLFDFNVQNVTPGGSATVKITLPGGFAPDGWLIQNPATGALERFDYDGATGAEVDGNVVTLHFVDGGRGDADGMANGMIADPSGPGAPPLRTGLK